MREDHRTEFKTKWSDKYLRNIAAFANSGGGTLYVGMDDGGVPVGIDGIDELLKVIPDKIQTNLGIVPSVDVEERGGKEYISIKIKPSSEPIFMGSRLYVKSGSTTREVPRSELRQYLSKNPEEAWANMPSDDFDFDDIDTYVFDAFKQRAKEYGELTYSELNLPIDVLLSNWILLRWAPTRVVLLFCNDPVSISPAAKTVMVRMKDSNLCFRMN